MINKTELLNTILDNFCNVVIQENLEKSAAHSGRVTSRFYPTEASAVSSKGVIGRCRRRTYYSQQDTVSIPETDIRTLGRFKVGNILEEWIRELASHSGIRHDNSVKIRYFIPNSTNVQVSGEVDIIYKIGDEIVGGEFKTSYGYDFESTVYHKDTIPGMPKVEHVMQVLLYLYYYKYIDTSLGITRFVITYLNRGSMEWIQHVVEMTEDFTPVINGIVMKDIASGMNQIFTVQRFNAAKTREKLLAYEFNLLNIFSRYNDIYNYHEAGLLIEREYNPLYSNDEIVNGSLNGTISKSKYESYRKGHIDFICDKECSWCPYRLKCLEDSKML